MPAVVAWALGAIGAAVLIKLFNREWQRVNDELDRAKSGAGERARARRRADLAARSRRPASTGRALSAQSGRCSRQPGSLMPLSRTTLPQRVSSSLRNLPNCCGRVRPPAPRRT